MIKIAGLTYRYSRKKELFNGLNMEFEPGKVYGLLGKNGAGKSSLIKNIAGLLFPTKGKCTVNNWQPRHRETAFLEEMFFIPEACELPALTVKGFIDLYAPFYPAFNREQFFSYLTTFSVSADGHLNRLSFGQKKKAYISFALAANTKLLIMDEPTNGLDIPSKLQFRNIVSNAGSKDRITIISTHQVRDLDDIINSIIIIDNGEVLLYADKKEVCDRLYFSTGGPIDQAALLYEEQTPRGIVCVSVNERASQSYLDLEVLFNATLSRKEQIKNIFDPKKTSHESRKGLFAE